MAITEGDLAPQFELPSIGGRNIGIENLRRKSLLYFFPKADTAGCTKQAQDFQRTLPQFAEIGLSLLGVSPDKVQTLEEFAEKYGLTFPLASDGTHEVAKLYGVWIEKSMYGRKYMGIERSTLLIDVNNTILKIWRKVSVPGHAEMVLQAAKKLSNS